MSVGDERSVTIPAEEAYGPRREELTLEVPRSELPPHLELRVGAQLQMSQGDEMVIVTIRALDDETVTLDANHELAGEALTFALQLVEILPG